MRVRLFFASAQLRSGRLNPQSGFVLYGLSALSVSGRGRGAARDASDVTMTLGSESAPRARVFA